MSNVNRQWLLAKRPHGNVSKANFLAGGCFGGLRGGGGQSQGKASPYHRAIHDNSLLMDIFPALLTTARQFKVGNSRTSLC